MLMVSLQQKNEHMYKWRTGWWNAAPRLTFNVNSDTPPPKHKIRVRSMTTTGTSLERIPIHSVKAVKPILRVTCNAGIGSLIRVTYWRTTSKHRTQSIAIIRLLNPFRMSDLTALAFAFNLEHASDFSNLPFLDSTFHLVCPSILFRLSLWRFYLEIFVYGYKSNTIVISSIHKRNIKYIDQTCETLPELQFVLLYCIYWYSVGEKIKIYRLCIIYCI